MADPILMSRSNPTGWKLEELIGQIAHELRAKNATLDGNPHPVAEIVQTNNRRILALLAVCEDMQNDTLARLDLIGPDRGPLAPSRLAPGRLTCNPRSAEAIHD